ncbi:MAG: 1-acyl-sn-glycerol-3-phosphate acyltransferase [Syntrophobacterales bacterium]|nr:MAG: 1-acyl-sn-glycerol-3-phosphate acyltransferase [Syntrophobacterales bacterium]
MKFLTRLLLYVQYSVGRVAIVFMALIVYIFIRVLRYRVRDIKKVRERVRDAFEAHDGPWIICPNHLTMIDSVVIEYAMVPLYRYITNYRMLPWNLPEAANFSANPIMAFLCYLAKCIPISRGGDMDKMRETLAKCNYLLKKKESILIFPEGGRSRTGFVSDETFSYGVGRFIMANRECKILCIYMRGDGQESYSGIPRLGERFTVEVETFDPQTEYKGLKGQREYARQIVEKLAVMEKRYFDTCGKRHHRFDGPRSDREEPRYSLHKD